MKYIIIEDEEPAANRLQKLIATVNPELQFESQLVSVKSAIDWLQNNPHPDLIFMDIQLADGNSFEIFKTIKPKSAIIFTTAYDEYAISAFKVNSIDYLLKPIKKEELKNAIDKFISLSSSVVDRSVDFEKLVGLLKPHKDFQKRLIIRFGETIIAVEINDVAYFYTEQKVNFLQTFSGKNYPIDQNLDQIDGMTDPAIFFRINRQFIVNINAIKKMVSYSKSRVKLLLEPPTEQETIVSTERSPHFKLWLTGSRE